MTTRSSIILTAAVAALLSASTAGAQNRLFIADSTLAVGAQGERIPVHCENDQDILGVSIAVDFDPAVLDIVNTFLGDAVADAEWSDGQITAGRVTHGVVFDFQIVEILPPAEDTIVLELVADVVGGPAETGIEFRDDPGPNQFNVLVSMDGDPIANASFEDGTITVSDVPPPVAFRRGDSNSSGGVDLSDAVNTLNWLFLGFADPLCLDAADSNDDGATDLTDAVFILNFLFLGLAEPPAPGHLDCGEDPSEDGLADCEYPGDEC